LDAADLLPVTRDFAFLVNQSVSADALLRAVKGADKVLITDAQVFDVFVGEAVGIEMKSVALSVRLQPREKTLTEAEIEAVSAKIVAAVAKTTGGSLRS
jgi:phenylalanyl-tRNA synthetase beta chain